MITFKITSRLLASIRSDLRRPHPYANERIGFISVGPARTKDGLLLLAQEYWPVADEYYVDNPSVGAEYDARAIRPMVELAYKRSVGIFHVHQHPSESHTFSPLDMSSIPQIVDGLFSYNPKGIHGAILLTDKPSNSLVWTADSKVPLTVSRFEIIGKSITKIYAKR